jgi:hypothetical protein
MPVKVMAWNVQNFGEGGVTYTRVKGANSSVLAEFIADVVEINDVDVLALMEVHQTAQPDLDNLLVAINARTGLNSWCYDWIPGSVAPGGAANEAAVQSAADLTWRSGQISPRAEGYAVLWNNSHADFRMLRAPQDISLGTRGDPGYHPAYVPGHPLSLNLTGRGWQQANVAHRFAPTANFNSNNPNANWTPSYYFEVARGGPQDTVYWDNTRRPAYFTLKLTVGGTDRATVWPVQVFHAPSYEPLARRSSAMAALGRELYVMQAVVNNRPTGALTYHDKSAAAGDYNVPASRPSIWTTALSYYHGPFNARGADLSDALNEPTNFRATEIKLNNWRQGRPDPTDPIMRDNLNDYRSRPIDNMFSRDVVPGNTGFVDVLGDVMQHAALSGAPVQRYLARLNAAVIGATAVNPTRGPTDWLGTPMIPDMRNWTQFYNGVQQGYFDGATPFTGTGGARSAAEFVRTFVSDHLPVWVELT